MALTSYCRTPKCYYEVFDAPRKGLRRCPRCGRTLIRDWVPPRPPSLREKVQELEERVTYLEKQVGN